MTPPGNGERPPRRLALVQAADTSAARETTPSEPPPSSPSTPRPTLPSLPPRSADLQGLRAILDGVRATTTPYQQMESFLAELANPSASRGYDLSLEIAPNQYQIVQERPGQPIEVIVTRPPAGGTAAASGEVPVVIRMTYLPNGSFRSNQGTTPHAAPRRGPERFFHDTLSGRLSERASRMFQGAQHFTKMESALQALEGRFVPESQAIWHDHLAVYNGRVYSFRRMHTMGLAEIQNPQHNRIAIFEETGAEQLRLATLSANGEIDYAPGRGGREPATPRILELVNNLVPRLEDAKVDPAAYQERLRQALRGLPNFARIEPTVRYSVDLPRNLSVGNTPRGYVRNMHTGADLLRHWRASHEWHNPLNPAERATLRPPWRLSRAMSWEMLRWGAQTGKWFAFESYRSPNPNNVDLSLHLFPEGGGQLSIYRNQQLHDIVTAGPTGPAWRADQEIRQMQREGLGFANRFEALQAAVSRRSQGGESPFTLHVQAAPDLDLNRLHLGADGRELPIRSVSEAWALLQRQIPAGVEARVDTRFEQNIVGSLLATSGEPNRIIVDFHQSQPATHIDISQQTIRIGSTEVPRIQIVMRQGENTYARVFENGVVRMDLARDVHQASLRQAQEGSMRRSLLARGGQGFLRAFSHVRASGLTYGLSHFASLPLVYGAEYLMYTPTERRLLGTPGLEANLNLGYLTSHVVAPFGAMALGSGLGTIAVDGFYNSRGGLWRTLSIFRGSEATLSQAWRLARPSFYNSSPFVRPASPHFFFRGFLQRAVPLFGGLVFMDRLQNGQFFSPSFGRQALNLGMVSLGSATVLRGIQASGSLSSALVRRGFLAEGTAAGSARFGLTFRGGLALAVLEMTALGILAARDRRELLEQTGEALRGDLGQAIDRRNELITRLELGEEVEPRHLFAADAHLQDSQAAYRRFLELTERTEGEGDPAEIGMENDFSSEERRYQALRATSAGDPVALAQLESEHRQRLSELRERYRHMEAELDELYARYGADRSVAGEAGEGLREFLARQVEAHGQDPGAAERAAEAAAPSDPVRPPIGVDSPDGRLIVDQLRWKASREPGFILWSRERRADYILREFRGYQVTESDGRTRSWNQAEALAFLDAVEEANVRRIRNLEAPLTLPGEGDRLQNAGLQELLESERAIRARESASHRHVSGHLTALADNVEDLDRQMEAYYRVSNERSAVALSAFLPDTALAMAH